MKTKAVLHSFNELDRYARTEGLLRKPPRVQPKPKIQKPELKTDRKPS